MSGVSWVGTGTPERKQGVLSVFKYIVVDKDEVIKRGESKYYAGIADLVPGGYRYTWAFRSPGGLIINVEK